MRLRIPFHGVGGELVDIGEYRLGQNAQHLGVESGSPSRRRLSSPRDTCPDPVGGLQRIEGASLPKLAAAQAAIHLATLPAASIGVAEQGDELAQRLRNAGPQATPEP